MIWPAVDPGHVLMAVLSPFAQRAMNHNVVLINIIISSCLRLDREDIEKLFNRRVFRNLEGKYSTSFYIFFKNSYVQLQEYYCWQKCLIRFRC